MGINWKELWCSSNTDMLIAELGTGIGKVPSCVAGDKADNRENVPLPLLCWSLINQSS